MNTANNITPSLHVLAYLFLRMNFFDKAERAYKALLSLQPQGNTLNQVYIALSFIALENNNPRQALQYINTVLQNIEISSKNAIIYLLRAKALHKEGREEEAKNAIAQYSYHLAGNK